MVFGRVADAVDRRHRRDDDAVGPLEDRLGRRQPHLLDVLVDRAVLLDVEVARRHVRLGLVVVVVRDEILDRVVREELAELRVELRGERLVRREHQRRAAGARDDVAPSCRSCPSRSRRAASGTTSPSRKPFDQLVDRLGLVARGLERLVQLVGTVGKGDDHDSRAGTGQPAILRSGRTQRAKARTTQVHARSAACGGGPHWRNPASSKNSRNMKFSRSRVSCARAESVMLRPSRCDSQTKSSFS